MNMKYIVRAIIYYPLLLSVCLFFEILIGLSLLCRIIWNGEISKEQPYGLFMDYFTFFSFIKYKESIKNGIVLIKITLSE